MSAPASKVDVLAHIGQLAITFVTARAARMAARRERNRVAGEFSEEFGSEASYSDDSDHPQHYSAEFIAHTGEAQTRYKAALAAEKSARARLYAAVRKLAAQEPRHV